MLPSGRGDEVDLHVPGTNLERFRVRTDALTYVERKRPVRISNPFTTPEPTLDVREVLERIHAVELENAKRLENDIAILTKYLKTKGAPKAAMQTAGKLEDCDRPVRRAAGGVISSLNA